MEDNIKQFSKRLMAFSMGPLVAAIISFFIVPITTYFLSPEEFGKAAMFTMALTISSLFVYLGLDQAFVREFHSKIDKGKVFANSVFLPIILSIIISILLLVFYDDLSFLLFNEVNFAAILYLSLCIILTTISRFSLLIIRMQENAKLYSLFLILSKFLNLLVLVPLLYFFDKTFNAIIQATFISLAIVTLGECIYTFRYWKSIFCLDKKIMITLLNFGFPLLPATLVMWLFTSMDKLALRGWSSYTELGLYAAAFKVVAVLGIFQQAFSTFWVPTAYRWYENGVSNEKFEKVSTYLLFILCFIFIVLVELKDIIIKIFDSTYSDAAILVPFLLFSPLMYTVSESTTLGIVFKRKTKYNIVISISVAILNFIGNFILVPKYGALGASISTGVSFIAFFWLRTLISRRLWFRFDLKYLILNTSLMVIVAIANLYLYNTLLLNIFFVFVLFYINKDCLKMGIKIIKSSLKNKNN